LRVLEAYNTNAPENEPVVEPEVEVQAEVETAKATFD
jgi:hypothetical protein